MADKIWSQNEILEAVKSKAASLNLDLFRARISRKAAVHLAPDILATFDDFNINHLTAPELWLPELFGGGIYEIALSHSSDINVQIAAPYRITYAQESFPMRKPTYDDYINVMKQPEWQGPTKMIFPRPPNAPAGTVTTKVTPGGEATVNGSTTTVGGPATPDLTKMQAASNPPEVRQEANRLMQVQENLMKQERELSDKKTELQFQTLRSELLVAQPRAVEQGPNRLLETITALAPFAIQFMTMQKESTERAIALQKEANDRHFAAQEAATARHLDLMKMVMTQKPEKDDIGQIKAMGEMMGTMANVSMQVIQSQAEMMAASQPQQESPAYKLARQAMVALSGLMGSTKAVMLPDDESQPQLPPGTPGQNGEPPKYSQLELLERAILRKDPKEKVALRFEKALKSKKFMQVLRVEFGGNFLKLVEARVGLWAAEDESNLTYLQEIFPFIWAHAQGLGLVPPAVPVATKPAEPETVVADHEHAPTNGASAPVETPSPEIVAAAPTARKVKVAPNV